MGGRGAGSPIKKNAVNKISVSVEIGEDLKKYPCKMPDSKQRIQIVKPQVINGKVFAGKGTNVEIKDRFRLESDYGIPADEWQKVSGNGKVLKQGKQRNAELHWYQAQNKLFEIKIKRFLDES